MIAIRAFRTGVCAVLCAVPLLAGAQIYRCDTGTGVPLYQNSPGPGCVQLDLPGLTTVPAPVLPAATPKTLSPGVAPGGVAARPTSPRPASASVSATTPVGFPRVDPSAQRSRDLDRRRILEDELRKEEARLAALRDEFREGEPERRGDERNYQKYLDRVERLKDDISRSESAVASLRREMTSLRD